MSDLISRQDAIDALERKKDKNAKGDIGGFYNKIIQNDIDTLMQMPFAQTDLINKIQNGIKATVADDVYSCGMRNGMRWCISLIDDKDPLYENCPSAQPEIIHCCDCKHRGEKPIADGRYWCEIHDTFMYYCSDAERRTDEQT